MIAVTSISPTHKNGDIQKKAIESWQKLGLKVYSLNNIDECQLLGSEYDTVTFVPTNRTMEKTYGKPIINLNAIFDFCLSLENENDFCIINSDIEIDSDFDTLERIKQSMQTNIVMANRINYKDIKRGAKYLSGIDVFFINRNFLKVFPQSMHALGMTFYDYFIPYTATKAGIQCILLEQDFAYHLEHATQYSHDNWLKSGRYFIWENELYQFNHTQIGRMSTFVYEYIYNSTIRKKI